MEFPLDFLSVGDDDKGMAYRERGDIQPPQPWNLERMGFYGWPHCAPNISKCA